MKAIMPRFQQCQTRLITLLARHSVRSASAICMSCTETITCLPQIVTLRGCEERVGNQSGTKVAP